MLVDITVTILSEQSDNILTISKRIKIKSSLVNNNKGALIKIHPDCHIYQEIWINSFTKDNKAGVAFVSVNFNKLAITDSPALFARKAYKAGWKIKGYNFK